MGKRTMPGLYKHVRKDGRIEWKIDKRVRKYGRVCEGTGTSDYDEAERYLTRRLEQIRQATVYGVRPKRRFREAATKYLNDHRRRRGISRDATALKNLDPYIGDKMLDQIHDGSFDRYREARAKEGISIGTVDRDIGTAARVLEEAARKWRDEGTNLTWLVESPMIEYQRGLHERYVFTLANSKGERDRLDTPRNRRWIAARDRATARYKKEFSTERPKGCQRVRAHDLRHTCGRRLRAAGVSLEDRQDLLGHEAGRITTHYSAAEIENLVTAANQITKSRESPTRTVLRLISA